MWSCRSNSKGKTFTDIESLIYHHTHIQKDLHFYVNKFRVFQYLFDYKCQWELWTWREIRVLFNSTLVEPLLEFLRSDWMQHFEKDTWKKKKLSRLRGKGGQWREGTLGMGSGIFKYPSGGHHVQEEASYTAVRQDQMVNTRKSFLIIRSIRNRIFSREWLFF